MGIVSRRRFRFVTGPDGQLVSEEVHPNYVGSGEPGVARVELMLDGHYDGLRATDGTPIDSRAKHREYMHRHGLAMADDFKGVWAKADARRAEFSTTGGDHAARRATVERVIHQLEQRNRR